MTTAIQPIAPRARRLDPETSHVAAEKAEGFAASHAARIRAALVANGQPMTAGEIGEATGLTVVQVDRRMHELEKCKKVARGKSRFCTVAGSFMCEWRAA